jgi:hypothetical protein
MSSQSIQKKIDGLSREMAAAAEAEDFERAARLRDEIAALRGEAVRQPPPGQMGLGTNLPVAAPPAGWRPPRRPDPLTAHARQRRRR